MKDIYALLSSKPHNVHYLIRYCNFILKVRPTNNLTEKHHILPRSIFPEYKNFKKFSWNKVLLTERENKIAHKILAKVFIDVDARYKMMCAAILMNVHSKTDKTEYFSSEIFLNGRKKLSIRKKAKLLTEKEKVHYSILPEKIRETWNLLSDDQKKLKYEPGLNKMNSQDTCRYCGFVTNKGNIGRYHNEKCKHYKKGVNDACN